MFKKTYDVFDRIYIFSPSFYDDKKYSILRNHRYYNTERMVIIDQVENKELKKFWDDIRKTNDMKTLIWFDDCMGQEGLRGKNLEQVLNNARHNNCSIVALVQAIVGVAPNFRRQCEGFIGFQTMDYDDRELVFKNFGIGLKKNFFELYDFCTKDPHSFILMNRQGPLVSYYKRFTPLSWTNGRDSIYKTRNDEPITGDDRKELPLQQNEDRRIDKQSENIPRYSKFDKSRAYNKQNTRKYKYKKPITKSKSYKFRNRRSYY